MAYDLTNITESVTPADLFISVNNAVDGYIGLSILLITFFSILIIGNVVRNKDMVDSFITSSFITSVVAMIIFAIGMIEFSLAQVPLGLLILSFLLKVFVDK